MTAARGSIQWICRRTSIPSRPGMQMSRRVRRGRRLANRLRACSPFDAVSTSCPWLLSTTCSSSQIKCSSSTTKMEAITNLSSYVCKMYVKKTDRMSVHFCSRVFRRRLTLCSHSSYIRLKNSRIIDEIANPSWLGSRTFITRPSIEMKMPCQKRGTEMCGRTKFCRLQDLACRCRDEQSAAEARQEAHAVEIQHPVGSALLRIRSMRACQTSSWPTEEKLSVGKGRT